MKKVQLKDLDLYAFGNTLQMSGVIFSGDGASYLCFFPASKDELPHASLEMDTDDWKTVMSQLDVMETEVLTQAADGSPTKIVLRKSQRAIDMACTWRVYKRDGYACRYCGNNDTPLTVDHLVTWESGGPSTEENLLTADRRCNKTRGNLPYEQWLQHPYYKKVSMNLTPQQRKANEDLVAALTRIPRLYHKRSR